MCIRDRYYMSHKAEYILPTEIPWQARRTGVLPQSAVSESTPCSCLLYTSSHDHISQHAVIHIHAAFPGDLSRINIQFVSLLNVVIQHGRQQIIGRCDGVKISCKMQIQLFHRNYLGISAARGPSLYAKAWSQGRLSQGNHGFLSHLI